MKRTFNYTDREDLPASCVNIELSEDGAYQRFDAQLDFSSLELPDTARIFLEAYYSTSFMRFDLGTVGSPTLPSDRQLTDFPKSGPVLFRVKIVDTEGNIGRILARRQNIRLHAGKKDGSGSAKESILPVRFDDFGDRVWKLGFNPEPHLDVNNRGGIDMESIVRQNGVFASLVFPQVLHQILQQLLIIDNMPVAEIRQSDGWENQWLKFAERICGSEAPSSEDDDDELQLWIEGAVNRFCSKADAQDRFVESFTNQ